MVCPCSGRIIHTQWREETIPSLPPVSYSGGLLLSADKYLGLEVFHYPGLEAHRNRVLVFVTHLTKEGKSCFKSQQSLLYELCIKEPLAFQIK